MTRLLACLVLAGCVIHPQPAQLSLHAAERRDELRWSIPNGDIDILSELEWKHLRSRGLRLRAEIPLPFGIQAIGEAEYGKEISGSFRDSDYLESGRMSEFSRFTGSTSGSTMLDGSLRLGIPLEGFGAIWMPFAGMAYRRQDLRLRHGFQVIPDGGNFPGLRSRYDASWLGPIAGLGILVPLGERWSLQLRGQAEWSRYSAEAQWNLRLDFAQPRSFTHRAEGFGVAISADLRWEFRPSWFADLGMQYQRAETQGGRDLLYLRNGRRDRSRFNGAERSSISGSIGILRDF